MEIGGGEIIDGKLRLTAANARRLAVALIDAADDFDGCGVLPDAVRRATLPDEDQTDAG